MMKKIISSVTALTLIAGAVNLGTVIPFNTATMTANAWQDSNGNYYTEVTHDSLTYWIYEDHAAVADCDESAEAVDIPAEIDGVPVTEIGDMAFWKNERLTKVTIPDTVTEIGWRAFGGCSLTEVIIPDSVKKIQGDAFSYCSELSEITFPEGLTEMSGRSFDGTKWLKNKQKESPLVIINNVLIDGTTCEGDITIPDNVTKISNVAFDYCRTITSITIPDSVTSLGGSAFYACDKLTSVTLPDSITEIESNTFAWCTSLTDINIPDSVISIGGTAFHKCYSLTEITIPDSVTKIGGSAFSACIALKSITIPDGVTEIYDYTFSGCDSLTDIVIPDSVTKLGYWSFSGCAVTDLTLPDGVVSISECAFSNCDHLTRVTIPESVEKIDTFAFFNCPSLSEITILNPNCELGDSRCTISNNAYSEDYDEEKLHYDGIIRGYENSTAQAYAEKYGFTFESLRKTSDDRFLTFFDVYEMTETERQALCERNDISYNSEKDIYNELTGGYVGAYSCYVYSDFLNTGFDSRDDLLGFETEMISNKDYYSRSVTEKLGLPEDLIELEYNGMSHLSSTAYIDSEFSIILKSDDVKEKAKVLSTALIFLEMNPNVIGTLRNYLGGGAYMKGDLNSDLQVTVADAVIMQQYLLGSRKWNGYDFLADINNDDRVDVFDLVLLRKLLIS